MSSEEAVSKETIAKLELSVEAQEALGALKAVFWSRVNTVLVEGMSGADEDVRTVATSGESRATNDAVMLWDRVDAADAARVQDEYYEWAVSTFVESAQLLPPSSMANLQRLQEQPLTGAILGALRKEIISDGTSLADVAIDRLAETLQ